ncbi:molybdopterin molybdotransferase MoeA [Planctomonas sp. JC2975]|uniref:molybdenum cofactor synthesis domain-containing protein n=1 Tax=Planctomonas sp. JC2975 TaxID=2729626 RepID=UPI001476673A|nr:molybdopterin molybdotransferase MoeA [Planctomonas sp. JC2975]
MTAHLDTIEAHQQRALTIVTPLAPVRLPLRDALGLVLAETLESRLDIPVFDNSAMDGYAVHRDDVLQATPAAPVTLRVTGDIPAGSALDPGIDSGETVRIMTGAPIPSDADAVVQLEHTDGGVDVVAVSTAPWPAAHIRRRGEDVAAGDTVLEAGVRLTAYRVAAAAAAGHNSVLVRPAPRIAVIATGSELREPGDSLERGQIPDSNSFLMAGLVAEAGALAVRIAHVGDEPSELAAELQSCLDLGVDAVLLSGGVSVGAYDVVKNTLSASGSASGGTPLEATVGFHQVAMQPGKPQGLGTIGDGTPVFALPGNPVSVAVSFEMFVRPALLSMQGASEVHRRRVTAFAATGWTCPPDRAQVMPIVFERAGAEQAEASGDPAIRVRPATHGGSGSHLAGGLGRAEGYAVVPADVDEVRVGDALSVMEVPS